MMRLYKPSGAGIIPYQQYRFNQGVEIGMIRSPGTEFLSKGREGVGNPTPSGLKIGWRNIVIWQGT